MITLISRWTIRAGITPDQKKALVKNLQTLAGAVERCEPHTLVYRVHTEAVDPRKPLDPQPSGDNACELASYIYFYEVYASELAFQEHLDGVTFNDFVHNNLKYFEENPQREGYPLTKTTFLHKESGFFRAGTDQ